MGLFDKAKKAADDLGDKGKEAYGKATGDEQTEAEGQAGQAKNAAGDAGDNLKDAGENLKDAGKKAKDSLTD
jgi:uncharacterized protein YjbJ (UPF0337 family)